MACQFFCPIVAVLMIPQRHCGVAFSELFNFKLRNNYLGTTFCESICQRMSNSNLYLPIDCYFVVARSNDNHPLVRNLDLIQLCLDRDDFGSTTDRGRGGALPIDPKEFGQFVSQMKVHHASVLVNHPMIDVDRISVGIKTRLKILCKFIKPFCGDAMFAARGFVPDFIPRAFEQEELGSCCVKSHRRIEVRVQKRFAFPRLG